MKVTLTWHEALVAANVGVARQVVALQLNRTDVYGVPTDPWDVHIEGAAAEMAVAKAADRYWRSFARKPEELPGDVGRMQVRSSRRPDARPIVHREDSDDAEFFLVVGAIPTFTVVGSIFGRAAKREEWWTDPGTNRPAYFVPQSALRPVDGAIR